MIKMQTYQNQVFDIIESFSFFDTCTMALAKNIFVDSHEVNMRPSNIAVCCLNVANEFVTGSDFKSVWDEVLLALHRSPFRKRKPTLGRKLYKNIIFKSEMIKNRVDLENEFNSIKVINSGSEIGYKN